MATPLHIGIVGGGIAGLFTSWYLLKSGQQVTLLEKGKIGQGCTWDAAGMLAPINELEFGELELLRAGITSRSLYAEVAKELGDFGLIESGTLDVALEQDDLPYLRRLFEYQIQQGLESEWVNGHKIKELDSFVSPNIPAAIFSPNDVQVDQRKLVFRLKESILKMGGRILEGVTVHGWTAAHQVQVHGTGFSEDFNKIVVAVGIAKDFQPALPYKIYPVRGEMISLEPPSGDFLKKTIRIRNKTLGNAYVVPKHDRIVVGSTSEEKGLDDRNTAGGLLDILRKTYPAVPGIYELPILETWAGLRPATLSRLPIIDGEPGNRVFHLNGLYRHGILLGPLAGKAMEHLVNTGRRMPEIESFRIPRF